MERFATCNHRSHRHSQHRGGLQLSSSSDHARPDNTLREVGLVIGIQASSKEAHTHKRSLTQSTNEDIVLGKNTETRLKMNKKTELNLDNN